LRRDPIDYMLWGHVMEVGKLAGGLANLLAPILAALARGDEEAVGVAPLAKVVWSKLSAELEREPRLREGVDEVIAAPGDPDALALFRIRLKKLLAKNNALASALNGILGQRQEGFPEDRGGGWRDLLGKDDKVLQRLEMIRLLRSGIAPEEVAKRLHVDVNYLFLVNARFSLAGVAGLLSGEGMENWLDRLDRNDPVLRRLDMVRLVRSGTPVSAVARAYNALDEYVERICDRFSRSGVAGVLTEDDVDHFHAVYPATIRVCSYNLHGTHNDGKEGQRFRRIAGELARQDPHAAAFQEVVSGKGIEETSAQIARWISSITGYHYRSRFSYCHDFMEKYPEGIALSLRCRARNVRSIDLTHLPGGLTPSLARNALVAEAEVYGRKVVFVSLHLDHSADSRVRLAQAEKLVHELSVGAADASCSILAGDFNDTEDSPVVRYLGSVGYMDAYRACHKGAGNTYPAGDPSTRIDYIFVKGHTAIVSSGLLVNDPEMSDHIGIFAEVL
jgi:endonuclease/exonuclease/phosphatase family metal-dependent hydrolase